MGKFQASLQPIEPQSVTKTDLENDIYPEVRRALERGFPGFLPGMEVSGYTATGVPKNKTW